MKSKKKCKLRKTKKGGVFGLRVFKTTWDNKNNCKRFWSSVNKPEDEKTRLKTKYCDEGLSEYNYDYHRDGNSYTDTYGRLCVKLDEPILSNVPVNVKCLMSEEKLHYFDGTTARNKTIKQYLNNQRSLQEKTERERQPTI